MAPRGFRSQGTWMLAGASGSARPNKCNGGIGRTAPLYSLHSQSAWSWHADLEGHNLPTWREGTGCTPPFSSPSPPTPFFGVEHHRNDPKWSILQLENI